MSKKPKKSGGEYNYERTKESLTNNFHANIFILVFAWIIILGLSLASGAGVGAFLAKHWLSGIVFTVSYIITSYWFSPDVDVKSHVIRKRGAPPLGPFWESSPQIIKTVVHEPLNAIYKFILSPFAYLFTHRGFMHWPVIGTLTKVLYFAVIGWVVIQVLSLLGIKIAIAKLSLIAFLFTTQGLLGILTSSTPAIMALVGAIVADFAHISIDYWDSYKKNSKFVPPATIAKRGLIARITGLTL